MSFRELSLMKQI
jgi:hypothetical protein